MDLGLRGKKALVCASSKGLGRAVAESLAREGADLFLCARDEKILARTAEDLKRRFGVAVHAAPFDLAHGGAPAMVAGAAKAALGHIDILVNNVGGPVPSAAHATSEAAWRVGFEQVFLSSVMTTAALLPDMRARKFGR